MAQLKIINFGPIKEGFSENNGFMNISPVTIFIGKQASGKKTIAKLYSTFSWLEKKIYRDDTKKTSISTREQFISYLKNQRIDEYLKDNSYIEYIGDAYHFIYDSNTFTIIPLDIDVSTKYLRPKIMYFPSERNLISVLEDADNIGKLPLMLSFLLDEYKVARRTLAKTPFDLPIPGVQVLFSNDTQTTKVIHNNSSIKISNASSGILSITPLILVSEYLSNEIITSLSKKIYRFFNQCFINIVEEPEQNLYPDSIGNVLYKLLEYNNMNVGNHLIITTHSPYILFYVTLAVEAWNLVNKNVPLDKIDSIINSKAIINSSHLNIYETYEDGSIKQLDKKDILPSDKDILNNAIEELSNKFAKLLELEEFYCK